MSKWKCEICEKEFENFHAQGFDSKIYCPLCFFKEKTNRLEKENAQLKEKLDKYDNPVDMTLMMMWCTEQVKDENKKLKKQLEDAITSYTEEHNLRHNSDLKLDVLENQQKEFIDYMNKTIEELECDDVDDEEMKGYLIQRIDTFKEILQKYKEIIGDKFGGVM